MGICRQRAQFAHELIGRSVWSDTRIPLVRDDLTAHELFNARGNIPGKFQITDVFHSSQTHRVARCLRLRFTALSALARPRCGSTSDLTRLAVRDRASTAPACAPGPAASGVTPPSSAWRAGGLARPG